MKFTSVVFILASAVAAFAAPALVENFGTVKSDLFGITDSVASFDHVINSINRRPTDAQSTSLIASVRQLTHTMSTATADIKAFGVFSDPNSKEIGDISKELAFHMRQAFRDLVDKKLILRQAPLLSETIVSTLKFVQSSSHSLLQALEAAVSSKDKISIIQAASFIHSAIQRAEFAFQ